MGRAACHHPPASLCAGVESILKVCHTAWMQGIMAGFSGNASVRLPEGDILITAAGTAKGALDPADCILLQGDLATASPGRRPSSESALHKALYAACSAGNAILHTHPPHLQALNILLPGENSDILKNNFLRLPLFESDMWRQRLFFAPPLPPGSSELAASAADALPTGVETPCAIWLQGHGLCVLGASLEETLALTEELEHLAKIQLLTRSNIRSVGKD